MKKLFLVGVVGLLLLTGCGSKKGDVVCSGKMNESGVSIEANYYGYLTEGKISRLDVEMVFTDKETADTMCTYMKQSASSLGIGVSCSGKTVTIENFEKTTAGLSGMSKDDFVSAMQQQGLTCK